MKYHNYSLFVEIDGIAKFMDVIAVSIDAALADIQETFSGKVVLRQWGQK